MRILTSCALFLGLICVALFLRVTEAEDCTSTHVPADQPIAGMGIMVGEVTPTSAYAQVRLTATDKLVDRDVPGTPGVVKFLLVQGKNASSGKGVEHLVSAIEKHDFIARAAFTDLQPNKNYTCFTQIGPDANHLKPGPSAEFRTLPGPKNSANVKFVVVTGMNYAKFHGDDRIDKKQHLEENNTKLPQPYSGPDKHLGYPALATILKQQPDFLVGTGDNVYYDTPDKPRAETIPELRQKWHEQFVQPRYKELFAKVPAYWMIDDHDYRIDDGDNSGDYLPTPEQGRAMMLEQLPVAAHDDDNALTYRTHRVTKDLQIWFPENRMYRSDNAMKDGPKKTIWGEKQKAWLKKTLSASDAKFKLLISPTPMVGPDDLRKFDNHTNINGFRHERKEFFDFLKKEGLLEKNFYVVCGDRHWQYHAVDPSGVEEFSCGALVDANSRLGRSPGDPKSTDPEGLIKQPYSQDPRSGGFLMIEVSGGYEDSNLKFTWHDELGKVLHQTVKE